MLKKIAKPILKQLRQIMFEIKINKKLVLYAIITVSPRNQVTFLKTNTQI